MVAWYIIRQLKKLKQAKKSHKPVPPVASAPASAKAVYGVEEDYPSDLSNDLKTVVTKSKAQSREIDALQAKLIALESKHQDLKAKPRSKLSWELP